MKPHMLCRLLVLALMWIILPSKGQNPSDKVKYIVKSGDTITEIARRFGMKPQELLALNNIKNANHIREGQELIVIDNRRRAAAPALPAKTAASVKTETKRYHVVMQGETLNGIARKYGVTISDLVAWNRPITADAKLKPGQKLVVGDLSRDIKPEQFLTGKGRIVNERGMGMMIDGADVNLSVALHRVAPEGSIIRIYNESTKRAVLAKVIGKIPDVDSDKKVIVKISKAACRALGVMNERFPVEVTYEK